MAGLLDGKVCLVTGGGSGIGQSTALEMAAEGAAVAVADLNLEGAKRTVAQIAAAGGRAVAIACDVTDAAQVAAMVARTVEAFGRLDGAFNNAGISASQIGVGGLAIADVPEDKWRKLIEVNLTGVWQCLRHEVHAMAVTGGGAIVNTASVGGLVGLPGSHGYVAAKHGVVGITKAASMDHAAQGIRVNAVCPGYIDTPMRAGSKITSDRIVTRPAMKRTGKPDEIAAAVVWLLSDKASFVTGTALAVDGGYTS